MHRTFRVPSLVGLAGSLALLTLPIGVILAQQPAPVSFAQPKVVSQASTISIGTGVSHKYTSKNDLKSADNNNAKSVNVQPVKNDPKSILIEGIAPGRATVTVTDSAGNVEVIEVVVISERVRELRDVIKRLIPTAAVDVSSTDSGTTLILSGTVLTAEDMRTLQQLVPPGAGVVNNVRIGGVQQVQLEVIVALVNRSEARNMAFSWNLNGPNWFVSSLFGGPFNVANTIATAPAASLSAVSAAPAGANIPFGILNNSGSFQGFLNALRTEGIVKIMSEPRVTTLSGRPAYIVSGGETPILTSSGQGAPAVSYRQFGTVVHFLPVVLGNGKIHLEVRPEISEPDPTLDVLIAGITPTRVPGFRTRSVQATVQIEDGQTLAIGGLIQTNTTGTITRVPFLGDLPFLGVAFTSKTFTDQEQELIILVTPRLVDPVDCCKIPKFLPGRESRIPDDFELFLEGIMEAPRGQRSVVFHPHYYKPAYHGSPNAGQIPCGDNCGPNGRGGNCSTGNCVSGSAGIPSMPTMAKVTNHPMPVAKMPSGATGGFQEMTPVRATIEVEPMPPMRGPSLGPVAPATAPTLPAREFENRPSLPPPPAGILGPR